MITAELGTPRINITAVDENSYFSFIWLEVKASPRVRFRLFWYIIHVLYTLKLPLLCIVI